MFRRNVCFMMVVAVAALAARTCPADDPTPVLRITLESSVDGAVVQPGDPVDWTISFRALGMDYGVALLIVDFVQNELNPGAVAIPPADGVPTGMEGFAAPYGISNVGDGSYRGTPYGTDCKSNLYQIGGAQNTFGVAGTTMGQDTTVETDVGQNAAQTLATGEFDAPDEHGVYVFQIRDAEATVFESVGSQGQPSVVAEPDFLTYVASSFTVIVCPGDVDLDGDVDAGDLATFFGAYGSCETGPNPDDYDYDCDFNRDHCVDGADLGILLGHYGDICNE